MHSTQWSLARKMSGGVTNKEQPGGRHPQRDEVLLIMVAEESEHEHVKRSNSVGGAEAAGGAGQPLWPRDDTQPALISTMNQLLA